MKFFSFEEISQQFTQDPQSQLWTAIIPAAGRGSRLGYDKPKILYPIAGRPTLDWLIDLLEPACHKLIFILSPTGAPHVVPFLEKRLKGRYEVAIQDDPRGMADAIYQAVPKVVTPHTLIIWGDQVGIRPTTLHHVMTLHQGEAESGLTLPIVRRENPYVHYATDVTGQFTHVLERREGATMPPVGESDCGLFACDTARLQTIFAAEIEKGISYSQDTKEWNFLPLLPQFDTQGTGVAGVRLESHEETIGVNDKNDAAILEAYLQEVVAQQGSEKLKVVVFSGGRGTGSISDALMKYPDIDLTMLVNAYDDGKSTGLLRRFIPGMLGPSDIRKVVSGLLKHKPDRSSQALRELMEYRFPDEVTTKEALTLLVSFLDVATQDTSHEVLRAKEQFSLSQLRLAGRYLQAFLDYYHQTIPDRSWFTFADNSLGNLFFGGCYLVHNQNFNAAIGAFCDFAEVGQGVVNITQGENLVLVGVKDDGRYLPDEAAVQGPQDASLIEEIFLLPSYIDSKEPRLTAKKESLVKFLRQQETLPHINPEADRLLRQADIIIYGPGTQHSSLFPSYLTLGVSEAIQANTQAEKIFIANIVRDNDILAEDASSLVDEFLWSMSRKETLPIRGRDFVTRFFFQKPEKSDATAPDYLPFNAADFAYPLDKVVWVDLEGAKGKHAGGRTVSELLLVVEEQLRKRIKHVPHKVSIIVPALNEEKTIASVLHALRDLALPDSGLEKEIIVIDGGSTDHTYSLIEQEPGVRPYQVKGKKGRGVALQLGIEKARGDLIVFFPSDNEYAVEDIARVINPLLSQEFPVVFGSRAFRQDLTGTLQQVYGGRGALFTISKYGGMLLSVLSLLFYQRYVSDPLTSIKGFNARVFRGLTFERTGVDFDMELIAKMARAKYAMLEVPVSYKARTVQEGKKVTIKDGLRCLVALIRFVRYQPKAVKPRYVARPVSHLNPKEGHS